LRLSIRRRRDIFTSLLVPRICVQQHTRQNRAPCHICFGEVLHALLPTSHGRWHLCSFDPLHHPHFRSVSYTTFQTPQTISSSIIQSRAESIYWARGENNLHNLSDLFVGLYPFSQMSLPDEAGPRVAASVAKVDNKGKVAVVDSDLGETNDAGDALLL
jgi:hypothetical protein